MTTGKTIALIDGTFVDKVMSLLFNMLSRLVIAFLPRSKCLLTMSLNENIATHSMDISYRHDIEKEVSIHRMEYVILFL